MIIELKFRLNNILFQSLIKGVARGYLHYFTHHFPECRRTFTFWQAEYLQPGHVLGTVMGFGQQKADIDSWQFGHLQSSWLQYLKMYREIIEYTTDFPSGVDAGAHLHPYQRDILGAFLEVYFFCSAALSATTISQA
jgi:hypothetical protein